MKISNSAFRRRAAKHLHKRWVSTRLPLLRATCNTSLQSSDALAITGTPRSGTTWLGQLLQSIPQSSVLFEPLHPNCVPEVAELGAGWCKYVPDDGDWVEGEQFLRRVFSGRVLNPWTTREMSLYGARQTRQWIVKFVRANLCISWMARHLLNRPPALILRHPCAVVASQMDFGNSWKNPTKWTHPELQTDFPQFAELFENVETPEEILAARWCVTNYVPLSSRRPYRFHLLTYERLVLDCEWEIKQLFDRWELEMPADLQQRFHKPSGTFNPHDTFVSGSKRLEGWKRRLSTEQIDRILGVVHSFGMDFYDDRSEPDYDRLSRFGLEERVPATAATPAMRALEPVAA